MVAVPKESSSFIGWQTLPDLCRSLARSRATTDDAARVRVGPFALSVWRPLLVHCQLLFTPPTSSSPFDNESRA